MTTSQQQAKGQERQRQFAKANAFMGQKGAHHVVNDEQQRAHRANNEERERQRRPQWGCEQNRILSYGSRLRGE
jgi:hypothetical protein